MLERYGHGGDLRTASEIFGHAESSFLDYSSNMNPAGPPSCVSDIFRHAGTEIVRYPDPMARHLVQKISEYYQIPKESIIVGNGAAELIDLVVRAIQPSTVGVCTPSFVEYSENALRAGARLHSIPLRREQEFDLQLDDINDALRHCELLMLGHPNNPTGRLIPNNVLAILTGTERMVMLDEAFIDFLENEHLHSQIQMAPIQKNLIVVRSMTKFFAVPGIRLGFAVAHPSFIVKLRDLQVHWSVNHFAQRIGEEVLSDLQYISETKKWTKLERMWFTEQLRQIGFDVIDSTVNYLLVRLSESCPFNVQELQNMLGLRGVLIRDASRFLGLNERYFRLAVRLRSENLKLLTVLRDVLFAK